MSIIKLDNSKKFYTTTPQMMEILEFSLEFLRIEDLIRKDCSAVR